MSKLTIYLQKEMIEISKIKNDVGFNKIVEIEVADTYYSNLIELNLEQVNQIITHLVTQLQSINEKVDILEKN